MKRLTLSWSLICIALTACNPATLESRYSNTQTATVPPLYESGPGKIDPPPGLVFLLDCKSECEKSLWIIDGNGKPLQIPFDGEDVAISHDHRFVAYQKDLDIWLLDLRSGDKKTIVSTPDCWEQNPAWSPDDKSIVFFACGNYELDDLYIFDLATEEKTNLTNTPDVQEACLDRYPAVCVMGWWEPNFIVLGSHELVEPRNGPLLAQCHTTNGMCPYFPTIVFINDGKYQVLDRKSGILSPPAISPNRQILAYDGGHLYELNTKIITTLLPSEYGSSPLLATIPIHEDGPELIHPVWSPDGRQIAWVSHVGKVGEVGITVFDLDLHTANIFYVYTPGGYSGTLPAWDRWPDSILAWSPNSEWLAFETVERIEGSSEIQVNTFVYDRYGEQLAKWNVGGGAVIWSPDSKRLAINDFDSTTAQTTILFAEIESLQIQAISINGDLDLIDWFSE